MSQSASSAYTSDSSSDRDRISDSGFDRLFSQSTEFSVAASMELKEDDSRVVGELARVYGDLRKTLYRMGFLEASLNHLTEIKNHNAALEKRIGEKQALSEENARLRKRLPYLKADAAKVELLERLNHELDAKLASREASKNRLWNAFSSALDDLLDGGGQAPRRLSMDDYYELLRRQI